MTTTHRQWTRLAVAALAAGGAVLAGGCGVERTLVINSDPPGALVYLNHEEVGRTPLRHNFTWYGEYDVQLRREGYQTLSATEWVVAPWWQWPPFDFVAELVPGRPRDLQERSYVLKPATQPVDPAAMIRRADTLRTELRSGEFTRQPAEPATTRPATTQPATTRPTTQG